MKVYEESKREILKESKEYWQGIFLNEFENAIVEKTKGRYSKKNISMDIDSTLSKKILKLSKENDFMIYLILLTIYKLCVYKRFGSKNIAIGIPQYFKSKESVCNNKFLISQIDLYDNKTFKEILMEVKENILNIYKNQFYPLDNMYKMNNINEKVNFFCLMDNIHTGKQVKEISDLQHNLITLKITRYENTININFIGNEMVSESEIKIIKNMFKCALESCLTNSNVKFSEINFLNQNEMNRLLIELNNTKTNYPKHSTISKLFEEQVLKFPNKIAIEFNNEILTYKELNEKSNSVARELIKYGVKERDSVGIIVDKSIEMIIGIIAILKIGASYVPIDHKYNEERTKFIIRDANIKVILCEEKYSESIQYGIEVISLNDSIIYINDNSNLNKEFSSSNLAYLIYTSGTTGNPKGTLITQYSVIRVVRNTNYIEITSDDTILQLSSYVFDGSVFDIFGALLNGAKLVIPNREEVLDLLKLSLLIEEKINVLFMTTALFNALVDINISSLKNIRKILFGGERVSVIHARKALNILGKDKIIHVYGPTESTVYATYYPINEINDNDSTVPIGKALSNTKLYILDKDNRINPIGVPGELCIGGEGLALGYLNNQQLNQEKFITNPYCIEEKLYKTGDLVRMLESGDIEFIDRFDQQVKIRGFRVELAEIEKAISKINGIMENRVIAIEDGNSKALCSYYKSDIKYYVSDLKNELKKSLPDFMIPSYFVQLENIPLTMNGKINKELLPDPRKEIDSGVKYEAPRNEVEEILVKAWEEILNSNKIGINEDFFDLGGDSIKAIQLTSRIKESGYSFQIKNLYENSTIKKLSKFIIKDSSIISQDTIKGKLKLSPIQKWFFNKGFENEHHFNQSIMIIKEDGFNIEILNKAINKIVVHHDALRMIYLKNNKDVIQVNRDIEGIFYNLTVYDNLQEKEILEKCNEIQSSIDLKNGPLIKLGLFKSNVEDKLLIVIHHLVIDGVSWRILIEDLENIYRKLENEEEAILPYKTTSFKEWADRQVEYLEFVDCEKEVAFWNNMLDCNRVNLPKQKDKKIRAIKDLSIESFELNILDTNRLLKNSNKAYNTEINHILLSSLAFTISNWTKCENTLINLEGHGRDEIFEKMDLSRTIGWFTSQYPLVLNVSNNIIDTLINTKDMLKRIPNKGVGYGIIKHLSDLDINRSIEPEISFNYLGQIGNDTTNSIFRLSNSTYGNEVSENNVSLYLLDFEGRVENGRLNISVKYDPEEFEDKIIQKLLYNYKENLLYIINHCVEKTIPEITISDLTNEPITIVELEKYKKKINTIKKIYKLTPLQEGILYHTLTDREDSYNIIMSLDIEGFIDRDILEQAFNIIIERHDILRTVFDYSSFKENMQIVYKYRRAELEYLNISDDTINESEYIDELIKKYKKKVFNLNQDLLMRLILVKRKINKYTIILNTHHILMDGWCIGLILNELFKVYNVTKSGYDIKLNNPVQYSEFIKWLNTKNRKNAEEYWKNYLIDFNQVTKLPFEKSNTNNIVINKKVSLVLDEEKIHLINKISKQYKVTQNTIIQSIWAILLKKYNNCNDVVFGYVVSGRNHPVEGIEGIVGLFINTIPLRIKFTKDMSFKELLININNTTLDNSKYDYLGLNEIQNFSQVKRNLIDSIFAFENYPIDNEGLNKEVSKKGDIKILKSNMLDDTNYDFNIIVAKDKTINIDFKYNEEVYSTEDVMKIKEHFENIVNEIVANHDVKVNDINILGNDEKLKLLSEFNNTAKEYNINKTVDKLFEEQVQRTPESIAVIDENRKYTYMELNERVNSLAAGLRKNNIQAGDVIAIKMERSINMIIGILAILKAGAGYLPVDPKCPKERLDYILEDSMAKILLTNDNINDFDINVLNMKNINSNTEINKNMGKYCNCHDLAYIIYTSGSTGKPKGVEITHKSVVNILTALQTMYPIDSTGRYIQKTNFTFDVSVTELFGWFMGGGTLVLLKNGYEKDPKEIINTIKEYSITHINFTSSMFNLFLSELDNIDDIQCLKYILTAGEALKFNDSIKVQKILDRNIKVENLYGPTEATVYSTYYSIKNVKDKIVIGKPISNTKAYILNTLNELCPINVPGELCLSGVGLARGYLNRKQLTNDKFIDNPYEVGSKLYKTGDLARWLPNGDIEYLGRLDNQVKIRGFRIEINEIENNLLSLEGIKNVAVIDKENNYTKYLVAYYVSDKCYKLNKIKNELKKVLPEYMIPSYFIPLDEMPLSSSGKVNENLLPEITDISNIRETYEAAINELEAKIQDVCEEILGIKKIGVNENLFDIGMDSLSAVKLCQILSLKGINIAIKDIFYYQTIRNMYNNCIARESIEKVSSCIEEESNEDLDIKDIEVDLLKQISKFNNDILQTGVVKEYNISAIQDVTIKLNNTLSGDVINLNQYIDINLLRKSIISVINSQGVFRSTIIKLDNEIKIQEYGKVDELSIPYVNLEKKDKEFKDNFKDNILSKFYMENLSINEKTYNRLLYSVVIIKLSDEKYKIYIPCNHLIFDGMSSEILKANILRAYSNNGHLKEDNMLEYSDYVKQLMKGPMNVTEEEIIEKFNLNNFKDAYKEYFYKLNSSELKKSEINIKLSKEVKNYIINNHWEASLNIFVKILQKSFEIENVPLVLLNQGRSYVGNNYYNTIGEFIDILPLTIKRNGDMSYEDVKELLNFAKEKNINFVTLLSQRKLKSKLNRVDNIFNEIYENYLDVPIFNYIEFYDLILEDEEIIDKSNIFNTNKMFNNISIKIKEDRLVINLFCDPNKVDEIKEEISNHIYSLVSVFIE